jgi:hypothetical protein
MTGRKGRWRQSDRMQPWPVTGVGGWRRSGFPTEATESPCVYRFEKSNSHPLTRFAEFTLSPFAALRAVRKRRANGLTTLSPAERVSVSWRTGDGSFVCGVPQAETIGCFRRVTF